MTETRRGATHIMIDELLRNDHRIEIPVSEADRYERLARAATRFKKAPDGMRVRVEQNWRERKAWVILEVLPSWMTATLKPIDVPTMLRQPSDVVVQLRTREDLKIQQGERNRALRLIEAIVREARSRGYTVAATKAPRKNQWGYYDRDQDDAGYVLITIGSDAFRLSVSQEIEKTPHLPSKSEQDRAGRGYAPPKFDLTPTPNLRITIEGNEAAFWRSFWSDNQVTPLEASLAQILQELELRHERAENNRREAERQWEERKRQWEAARLAAIEQLIQSHRAEVLKQEAQEWELANRIHAYVAAMDAQLADHQLLEEREDTAEWIRWARDYAQRIDPLNSQLRMPDDPEPTHQALAPFMKGWSPYGPD
jgi:hypothetical protein